MIVDLHTHLWESLDQLGPETAQQVRAAVATPWQRPDVSPEAYDEAMTPVRYAVILGLEGRHISASIPAQQVAKYVARQPDKYMGFAGIDPIGEGYLSAVKQAVDLGLIGVTVSPPAGGFHPSNTRAMRLYERCEEMGLPVLFQLGAHMGPRAAMEYTQPYLFDEMARSFPDLRVVLAGACSPWAEQAMVLIGKHPHCYADLSGVVSRPWQLYNVLVLAHQHGVTSKLLLGSGFPFNTPQQAVLNIYSVNSTIHGTQLPAVPRELLRGIVERDTLACLGLKQPQSEPTHHAEAPNGAPVDPQTNGNGSSKPKVAHHTATEGHGE